MSGEIGSDRLSRRRRSAQVTVRVLTALATLAGASLAATFSDRPASAAPASCVLDIADVIAWWRGENDLAGEIGPSLTGTATFADAEVDRGIVYDGTIVTSTAGVPVVTGGVTFEAWIQPVDNGLVQTIVSRWDEPGPDDDARSYQLQLLPGALLDWQTDEITLRRPARLLASVPQVYDGSFHHIAVTWSLTSMAIFVDGVELARQPSQGLALNAAAGVATRLGSKSGLGDPFYFSGTIDEATIWQRALDEAEVDAIHDAGAAGKCSFVPVERSRLLPIGGSGNSWFGFSVDIDGTSSTPTVIVGAPLANAPATFSGAAYVYAPAGSGWSQQAKLTPSDFTQLDQFGYSVAISGDTAVIGSYGNNGGGTDSGAVYVFVRTGTTWSQQAKLLPADIAAADGFGYAVAIEGATIVVGSPADDDVGSNSGSAYVFTRSGTTWTEQGKLTASDAGSGDNYGAAVAISGDTVVVGASGDDDPVAGANIGAAYTLVRAAGNWIEQAKLVSADAAADDQFGSSVGVSADTVVVGAPLDDDAGNASGSAYVFTRTGTLWSQALKLVGSDTSAEDRFGISAAIDSGRLVVGAYFEGGALAQSGAAYVFDGSGSNWTEITKLIPADAGAGDRFGISVAVAEDVVVGAYLDDDLGGNAGGAYIFAG